MKFKLIFKWYDLWVGLFIDYKKRTLYFFPLPMIGIVFISKGNYCRWCKKPKEFKEMENYDCCKDCDKNGGYHS